MNVRHEQDCFHCGLPVPQKKRSAYSVSIDGNNRAMCCPGCQAVAQAIVDGGLIEFYRYRTNTLTTARTVIPEALQELTLYDQPELQRSFVSLDKNNFKEASLILEGIVCAACIWLNEKHVNALPGVMAFQVNYATHRARLRWDDRQIPLSHILQAIAAIGYTAHPFDVGRQEAVYKKERRSALKKLAVAGLGATQVMMLAVAMYAGDSSGMNQNLEHFMRWVSLFIATPVVLYSAQTFFMSAWRDLKCRQLGMDVPVSLAIGLAYLASNWATVTHTGEVYFDSVTMFTFFLLVGRFFEMAARQKAGQAAEALVKLLPAMATRLTQDKDEVVTVSALLVGDKVRIKPGDSVPADGVIITGQSNVDESLLTGESMPVAKEIGQSVIGGSVNIESPLVVEVQKVGEETVLAAIQRLLDRAQSEKPAIAKMANKVAGVFVALLLLLVSAVGLWWWWHDPDQAFWIVLSLLVVTCPCALSLATPAAMTAATGRLTRLGVLTTRGHALETLARVTHVVLDKTGTLTQGRLSIQSIHTFSEYHDVHCLNIAAGLELGSEHPVAKALSQQAVAPLVARDLVAIPGQGITGVIEGVRYRLGNRTYVEDTLTNETTAKTAAAGLTEIFLANDKQLLAIFCLNDILRAQAAQSIAALQQQGKAVWLLSGDNEAAVAHIAEKTGITVYRHTMRPEDKLEVINHLQAGGAIVAMVGDGVNDAPVLAAAQVSIAMGGGTQLAQASADMVLLSEHLPHLVDTLFVAERSLKIIKQNLAWAILYNLVALPLAAMGYVAPWMAAIGMSMSSLVVVLNALRLNADTGYFSRQDDGKDADRYQRSLSKQV